MLMQKNLIQLSMTNPSRQSMKFEESRFSLQYSILAFWTNKEFTFLNLNRDEMGSHQSTKETGSLFELSMSLDRTITME